jgi:catechol 2,3-dioxygenase-like lactoylglutathione lyase family enzyme
MKIKKIGFVAIPVTDMKRAREFYEGVLGLKESTRFMDGKWIEYDIGDDTLCIASISNTWTPSDQGTGPPWKWKTSTKRSRRCGRKTRGSPGSRSKARAVTWQSCKILIETN